MNTEQLKIFVLLSEEKSFNKAAQKMDMTVSNVTYHINALEDETNVKLINRSKRGVELTAEGVIFLDKAHSILGMFDDFVNTFSDSTELKIGIDTVFVPYFYDDLLERFTKETGYKVFLNGNSEYRNLYRSLVHNEIDAFYFLEEQDIPEGLKFTKVRDEKYYAVTKKGLFMKEKVTLKDLEGYRLFTDDKSFLKNKVLIHALTHQNVNCQVVENEPQSTALQKTKSGEGISVIQDVVKKYFLNTFDVKEIEGVTIPGGIYYKYCTSRIDCFIEFLKDSLR